MKTFVSAEFDSVDMADLAAGRLRRTHGVIGAEVIPNKLTSNADNDSWMALPAIPIGTSSSVAGAVGVRPLFTAPFDNSADGDFEPALRRDALLRVEVTDDNEARQVSSVLRNIGGINISFMHR